MRLIDADALGIGRCNPDIFENKAYAAGWNAAVDMIENAPTVDAKEKTGRIEDLEEQGVLLCMPCKVGDTVYEPRPDRGVIFEYVITSVEIYDDGMFFNWKLKEGIYSNLKGFSDFRIGKIVFLSREEAEQRLKEWRSYDEERNF